MKKYKVELNKTELCVCVCAVAHVWPEDTLGVGFHLLLVQSKNPIVWYCMGLANP